MVGGIYRVLGRLGEGAMGVVLLAHDEQLQRKVAIKLIRPAQGHNRERQGRLLDEARAMAGVHHPNVVEIHAFGEHEGATYFVMQYVEGETLDNYARRRGGPPLVIDEALGIVDQMCLGVGAIHASGIAHRDLKPSNILIGPALRVVVADLGLAKKLALGEPHQRSFSGTPAYLAPEVAIGRYVDPALLPRADVYALGLIAYWLLVGRLPFKGKNGIELFKQHATRRPPRPSELRPELGTSFDAPLLAALVKDPADRTQTAEQLRSALHEARNEAPLSCGPMRIVVADDSDDFRSLVTEVLQSALPRAHIEAVPDGAAALAAIRIHPPALGVFDIDMPGLDGIALTAAVRALPRGGSFPIIIATGARGAADWQHVSRLGASAFLLKPFDAGQLITLARALVGLATQDAQP
jgi:serine/threonine-protein kinase